MRPNYQNRNEFGFVLIIVRLIIASVCRGGRRVANNEYRSSLNYFSEVFLD